jgi:hypothetical protein
MMIAEIVWTLESYYELDKKTIQTAEQRLSSQRTPQRVYKHG